MSRTTLATLALALILSLASIARADVVSDDSCHRWEHWQGGHSGRCSFGPSCSVSPALGRGNERGGVLAGLGTLVIAGVIRRRRSPR